MLSDIFQNNLNLEKGFTAGVGCLLLHGTWSHLWYIQRSVYAHSLICISYRTFEIEYCSLYLSFLKRSKSEWFHSLSISQTI
jgi:hypothetical protein